MQRNIFVGAVCLVLSIFSALATGETDIKFTNTGTITLNATYGLPFSDNLTLRLTDPTAPNLTWTSTQLPPWLKLNSTTGVLSGNPTAQSVSTNPNPFQVSVSNQTTGDANHPFQIIVTAAPIWTVTAINLGTATVGTKFSFNLSSYVTNPLGTGTITYTSTTLPAWLSLNSTTGVLSGTPGVGDIGPISITDVTATLQGAGSSSVPATGTVVVAPPYWTANPITLPNTTDESTYSQPVASYAVNPEGTAMTFSEVSGPAWVSVSAAGVISGTPAITDDGPVSVSVQFQTTIDGQSYSASTVFNFTVTHVKRPPVWSQSPVVIQATVGVPFSLNLGTLATDPEAGTLTFTATGLPSWLSLSPSGVLSGTPPPSSGGAITGITFTATASDGLSTSAPGQGTVAIVAPYWTANPIALPNATDAAPYSQSVTSYAVNPEGTPMTFSMVSGPAWAKVSAAGVISGSPLLPDDGAVSITVQFTTTIAGQVYNPSTVFTFTVVHVNNPPVWSQNPVQLGTATVGQPYTFNLNTVVTNPESGPMTFSATGLPSWLTLNPTTGVLSGTPPLSSVGPITGITFTASANGGSSSAAGQGTVQALMPVWTVTTINLGTATVGQPFTFNVTPDVTIPSGAGPVTFTATGLPGWLTLNPTTGVLSGTPGPGDIGPFIVTSITATIQGQGSASVGATGTVVPALPYWTGNPITIPNANDSTAYSQPISSYAVNPEGTPMVFSMVSGPSWASVSTDGIINGSPAIANDGPVSMTVQFQTTIAGQSYTLSTVFNFTVVHVPRPPTWSQNPVQLGTVTVGQPFTFNLNTVANNPEPGALTFTATGLPGWLTLNPNGTLSGTPTLADVGTVSTITFTATNAGGSAQAGGTITVQLIPPTWSANPISLGNLVEGQPYTKDVTGYVINPSQVPLTYSMVSGPDWASVSPAGVISGTPPLCGCEQRPESIVVQFTGTARAQTFTASTTFNLILNPPVPPPVWSISNVNLGTQYPGQPFTFDLNTIAKDPKGGALTFSATGLPAWMTLATNGILSGTPQTSNIGPYTGIVFTAIKPGATSTATGYGVVAKPAYPPTWIANPITLVDAYTGQSYTQDVSKFVLNPDSLPLTYAIVSLPMPPPWIAIQPSTGSLFGTPAGQTGPASLYVVFTTTVDGQPYEQSTQIQFNVIGGSGQSPTWVTNPIPMTASQFQPFTGTLKGQAQDPAGLALTFSLINGPSWLTVAADGSLSGTPPGAGVNTFTVQVCNTIPLCAQDSLVITVEYKLAQTETIPLDTPVPGASVESLWVIGASGHLKSSSAAKALSESLPIYFEDLSTAGLHHSGALVVADGKKTGSPAMIISWSDTDTVSGFKARLAAALGKEVPASDSISPIWSLFRFYQGGNTKAGALRGVPVETLIVSTVEDAFKSVASRTDQENWTAQDYAKSFIELHSRAHKPYRVSTLFSDADDSSIDNSAMKELIQTTSGAEYSDEGNAGQLQTALHDYAQKVILRANVSAHHRLKLAKVPSSPSRIQVSLAGSPLAGNRGATDDAWTYDLSMNEIVLRWDLILRDQTVKPGDSLRIEY